MSLSNIPDFVLIRNGIETEQAWKKYIARISDDDVEMPILASDVELSLRNPEETAYYSGIDNNQGEHIFLPVIRDWNEEQGEIEPLSYWEDKYGNEVWL